MKATPEQIRAMRDAITDHLARHGETIPTALAAYREAGLSAERCRWDLYWTVTDRDNTLRAPRDWKDAHIDTLLRRATS